MRDSRFIIGIDLGTTNIAVTYVDTYDDIPKGIDVATDGMADIGQDERIKFRKPRVFQRYRNKEL